MKLVLRVTNGKVAAGTPQFLILFKPGVGRCCPGASVRLATVEPSPHLSPQPHLRQADWYPSRQTCGRGCPTSRPHEQKPTGTEIPADALQTALDFAEAQNSVALLVIHRDELVLEQYWQDHPPHGLVNSMSMVKSLLALLIGIAIEEGHIQSIAEPVRTYLPEWAGDPRGDITLADLLYMQSGLENDDHIDTIGSDLVQLYMGSNANKTTFRYTPGG